MRHESLAYEARQRNARDAVILLREVAALLAESSVSQEAELRKRVSAFVERCRDIRNGSPNAFYGHVDAFCKEVKP